MIAAITTEPCSSSNSLPSIVTGTECGRVAVATPPSPSMRDPAGMSAPGSIVDGGSLAGNVWATASSWPLP